MSTRPPNLPWWVYVIVLVVACSCFGVAYRWSNSNCEERGGHTEIVYGGRGGWVCDGADR